MSYEAGALDEVDLAAGPAEQFHRWYGDAAAAEMAEPNAMVLSTAGLDAAPSGRIVLLKELDARGFVFYTNLTSRKSRQLLANPAAALVFPWFAMQRQVLVTGLVEQVDRASAASYFASRPYESQLGAWASHQSEVIASRGVLAQRYAELEARWPPGTAVPLPDFWGGWRVVPDAVEFWQGRQSRLHDRLRYARAGDGWRVDRLSP